MKQTLYVVAMAFFFTLTAGAQLKPEIKKEMKKAAKEAMAVSAMKGYVVDQMCAKGIAKKENMMEKAAGHTKACALEENCAESGYGLFSDGKYYPFDEAGSKKAHELIEKTSKKKEIMVEVTGTLNGATLAVSDIKEAGGEMKDMKMEKDMKKN